MRMLMGAETAPCSEDARAVTQSAVHVDEGSIDRVLALEAQMRDRAIAQESRYSRAAAEAISLSRSEIAAANVDDSGAAER